MNYVVYRAQEYGKLNILNFENPGEVIYDTKKRRKKSAHKIHTKRHLAANVKT